MIFSLYGSLGFKRIIWKFAFLFFETDLTNDSGWFQLSEHRGKIVIIDFMAVDCQSCHLVQEHLEILLKRKNNTSKTTRNKISKIGKKILKDTQKEIDIFIKNAI